MKILAILAALAVACAVETASAQCESGVCSVRPVAQRLAGNSDLPRPGKRLIGLVKRILGR